MKEFIFRSFAVIAIVGFVDFSAGLLFKRIYSDLPDIDKPTCSLGRALLKEDAEVVILGSSTADRHYNPSIMSDYLGKSVYNAGRAGHDIIYCDIVLRSFIERGNLKLVILDVNRGLLNGSYISATNDLKPFWGLSKPVTSYYNNETD